VINTERAARELLTKRAQIYSDKPRIIMFELEEWDWSTAFLPYGDRWRDRRRLLHQALHINVIDTYIPTQTTHVKKFLFRLHNDPKKFRDHVKTLTAGIVMSIAYAHEITDNDSFVATSDQAIKMALESVFPGAAMVNVIPSLRYLPEWFPGASFQVYARKCRGITRKMRFEPVDRVRKHMVDGAAMPSITRTLLESEEVAKDNDLVADVAGVIYAAGSDTLTSAISSCISALVLHSDVQHRAWAEIDSVVGRNRLPTHEDRKFMPYIEAICREILRWRVVTPLGLARSNTCDDVYDGWLIPKGTVIFWNAWAMAHDPDIYPDPDSFKPERWLDSNGQLNGKEFDAAFGYGRRLCIGINLAKSTLWLSVACMLAVMEFRKSKDENGNEIDIAIESSNGFVTHPVDFKCDILPRDSKACELLENLMMSK